MRSRIVSNIFNGGEVCKLVFEYLTDLKLYCFNTLLAWYDSGSWKHDSNT